MSSPSISPTTEKGEFGKGGAYVLKVDGAEVAETTISHTVPFIYSVDETLDVGEDRGTPILEDYADRMPFKYNGRIDEVDIDLEAATPPRRSRHRRPVRRRQGFLEIVNNKTSEQALEFSQEANMEEQSGEEVSETLGGDGDGRGEPVGA